MFGPSGFFQNINEMDGISSSGDIEIIHDSEAGFNILYRVSKNGRFFVYKALKSQYRGNPLYEELLKKDFNIGFSLTHPNVCQYYGMVHIPSLGNCIVMEWVDGCTLEKLLAEGRVDGNLAEKLICELCDTLDYMHRKQIIHRDLKPENILVTYNGQNVKLIDFGLSDADSYHVLKAPAGTKVYASPELLSGEQIDGRSDIWSLGMIIGEISGRYGHVVAKCLRRERNKRFTTTAEVKKSVLNANKRTFLIYLAVFFTVVLIVTGVMLLIRDGMPLSGSKEEVQIRENVRHEKADDAEKTVNPENAAAGKDVAAQNEPIQTGTGGAVTPGTATEVKNKAADQIDSATLDDLFKEASEQL